MLSKLDTDNVEEIISKVCQTIMNLVENEVVPLSSESTFRFLFAWELGRLLEFTPDYRVDFEWHAYSSIDTDDKFLDLLVYTDPKFKIALEFKLPKSTVHHKSNTTQTRAKICRDISRLNFLVTNKINFIQLGFLLCATNEGDYLSVGRKTTNPQYKTYQGTVYFPGAILPKGEKPNGIERELIFPNHEIRFEWQGIEKKGITQIGYRPRGHFAWLKPIKIYA